MTDIFTVHSLSLEPETSLISAPLSLTLVFSVLKSLPGSLTWNLTYLLDYTGTRHSKVLFTSDKAEEYQVGEKYTVTITTPEIDISQVKRKVLLNVGLMSLEARSGEEAVFTLNMVTHVSRDKEDDQILKKTVLNPID